jgi:LmbE family N-acetylglucosaminyl deacetylase
LAGFADTPAKTLSVLVVIAHPDDETMFGGVLGYIKEHDADVRLVCVTRGEGGHRSDVSGDLGLIELRPKELEKAAELYGIKELIFLNEPDLPLRDAKTGLPTRHASIFLQSGAWNVHQIKDRVESFAEKFNPQIVITLLPHHPALHAHHKLTGRLIMEMQKEGRLGDRLEAIYATSEVHWYPAGTFAPQAGQINFPVMRKSEKLGMTYAEFQHNGALAHASQSVSEAGIFKEDEVLVPLYEKHPGQSVLRSLLENSDKTSTGAAKKFPGSTDTSLLRNTRYSLASPFSAISLHQQCAISAQAASAPGSE